jgi:hypothetical protein
MRASAILASLGLLLATAPAWADGAPPDDCMGKAAGASCYSFDAKLYGVCVDLGGGLLGCQVLDAGTGGTGGTSSTGSSTKTGTGTTTTTVTDGGDYGHDTMESGCATRSAPSSGIPEGAALIAFGALCAALQRRRR